VEASGSGGPSEEELRARLEEELRRITVDDVLFQTVVTLVNLGGQRLGIAEGTSEVRDLAQSRTAIEAVRALLPLLEQQEGVAEHVRPIRDALSQLQMAYVREADAESRAEAEAPAGGEAPSQTPAGDPAAKQGESPGASKAHGAGRLWVPPGSST
jgi:hypothetical protein